MEEPPVFPKKTNYVDKMKWGFNHIAGAAGRFGDFQDRDLGHSGPWGNVGWLWSSFPTHSQVFFFSLSINGFVHRRKQPDDPDRHNGDFDLGHWKNTIDGLSLGWPPWPVGFTKLGPWSAWGDPGPIRRSRTLKWWSSMQHMVSRSW